MQINIARKVANFLRSVRVEYKESSAIGRLLLIVGTVLTPFGILALALARAFRFKISIFLINSRFYGHLALDTELQLICSSEHVRICALQKNEAANLDLLKIIRRHVYLWPKGLIWPLWRLLVSMPSNLATFLGLVILSDEYREFAHLHLLAEYKRHIVLNTPTDVQNKILDSFGLKAGGYFCIAIRDGSYHEGKLLGQNLESYRNQSFDSYFEAIEKLQEVRFVRIGRGSYDTYSCENLIDYTRSGDKSDLADLVILKNSLGLINGGDGHQAVALVFEIPVLLVRSCPWEIFPTFSCDSWIVPAIVRQRTREEILTIKQIFELDKGNGFNWPFPGKGDYYIHEFDRQEIYEYVRNFVEHFSGKLQLEQEHEVAIRRFWDAFYDNLPGRFKVNLPMHRNIEAKIPIEFLKRYASRLGVK
ncbi:MAG: TIGR04372 family glycosyltransferase [Micrococcales bacterium]|nr:TIGR04372 family glycosyltransferase [Micrococcales bacterium]